MDEIIYIWAKNWGVATTIARSVSFSRYFLQISFACLSLTIGTSPSVIPSFSNLPKREWLDYFIVDSFRVYDVSFELLSVFQSIFIWIVHTRLQWTTHGAARTIPSNLQGTVWHSSSGTPRSGQFVHCRRFTMRGSLDDRSSASLTTEKVLHSKVVFFS